MGKVRERRTYTTWDRSEIYAWINFTIVRNAIPTPYEQRHIWGVREQSLYVRQSAIHIREVGVEDGGDRNIYETRLINVVLMLAKNELWPLPVIIDVRAKDAGRRARLRAEGFQESIFWHDHRGRLMIRFRHH